MEKIGKFNLIDENVCDLSCNCGWNIRIGGENADDLRAIKKFLKEYGNEEAHEMLVRDIDYLVELATNYEFHDFKSKEFSAPKVALIELLRKITEKVKEGVYDN